MLTLLVCFVGGSEYGSVHSDKALSAPEYAQAPLTRLLSAPETRAFFRPLLEGMERRRADDLPADCTGRGAISVVYDVAARLTELAKESKDERPIRVLTALGLSDAQTLTLCIRPAPSGGGTEIAAFLALKRYSGLLSTFGPNDTSLEQAFAGHYWSAAWALNPQDAWIAMKQLDRAWAGTRGSRIDAIQQGAGTVLGVNVERALIQPLTGHMRAAQVVDAKSKQSARVFAADASETSAAATLAQAVEEAMPHAELGRKRQPNEWGFAGALTGVGALGGSVFLKLFDKRMVFSDAPFGLDLAQAKLATKLPAGVLALTIDLARYRALYERVGRPADTKELFSDLHLQHLVDLARAPHPKHLFTGMDRATFVVVREDSGLRLFGAIR